MAGQQAIEGTVSGQAFAAVYVLESKVQASVDRMTWLEETDEATVQLALQYARRIDVALRIADENPREPKLQEAATKALYLGPHLLNTMRALGGAPGERMDLTGARAKGGEEEDEVADFLKFQKRANARPV